jgi:hypothetical protein
MQPMSDLRSDRRRLALVLTVSLLFVLEWAFHAWGALTGEAPEALSHVSAPAGIGIDPNGECPGLCPGANSTTPPGGPLGGL